MSGRLVISLDFELMWGVRDHSGPSDYGDAVMGVRKALPALLERFERHGIRATWATVGLLFARNRDDIMDHAPELRPTYDKSALSPYAFIENDLEKDENEAPLYYGRSLLDRILAAEGQEVACHTFSHYFCLEPGQTLDQFRADLAAANSIAASAGRKLTSIVFPRNQFSEAHIEAAAEAGLRRYRGNQGGFAYRSRSGEENTLPVRGIRLLDGITTLTGRSDFAPTQSLANIQNLPASRFLRPWSAKLGPYSKLHIRHIKREMEGAARDGRCYHLWWHPHNMGRHTERNLAQLDNILAKFRSLSDRFGMQSCNMADFLDDASLWRQKSIKTKAAN